MFKQIPHRRCRESVWICVNLWIEMKRVYAASSDWSVRGRRSRAGTLLEWRCHPYFDFGC
jgi:hypothetical protein